MTKRLLSVLIISLLLASCAKISVPTGGPRDTTPPAIVKITPDNNSLNFNSKSIKITFNEFVVLDNPNKTLIVSPPLSQNPELTVSNKSVIVKINDTLQENTTYNIIFAETIKDFTEGNAIPFFNYCFSTGDHIDSFQLSGQLIDAMTLKPVKDALVMLYDNDIDSLPYTTRPIYITKSKENGSFLFTQIKKEKYKIFALEDVNSNLIYDLPNERIAFCDSTIESYPMPRDPDTLITEGDTTVIRHDSIKGPEVHLSMFQEKDTMQAISKYINTQENIYSFPYKTNFKNFSTRYLSGDTLQYFQSINATQDTVTWYMTKPVIDTSWYEFTADNRIDSVKINPFKNKSTKPGRGKNYEKKKLGVTLGNKGNIFQPLLLNFNFPVKPADSIEVCIIKLMKSGNDTLFTTVSVPDTFTHSIPVDFHFEGKTDYQLIIKDSVFFGYHGLTNDSIKERFSTKSEKDYGNLQIHYSIADHSCQYIVSLITEKGLIVQQDVIFSRQTVNYLHLDPGSYKIHAVKDRNFNGKWDTGDYYKKLQAEEIFFFPKELVVRGYWDIEDDFELK